MGLGIPMDRESRDAERRLAEDSARATREAMDEEERRRKLVDTPERDRYDPSGNSWKGKGRFGWP